MLLLLVTLTALNAAFASFYAIKGKAGQTSLHVFAAVLTGFATIQILN